MGCAKIHQERAAQKQRPGFRLCLLLNFKQQRVKIRIIMMVDFEVYYFKMLWSIICVVSLILFIKGVQWFLSPYFVYKNRTMNKDIEFWVGGTKQTKE